MPMSDGKPFRGLAFCCTGIPSKEREEIAEKTVRLGGKHYSDLMSDVHYLLVGNRDTDKYTYCIRNRHDIKFLRLDAIHEMYDKWIRGEDVVISNFRLPIFDDMTICLSRFDTDGFSDLFKAEHRKFSDYATFFDLNNLAKLITQEGGKITESLTTSHTCIVTSEEKGKRFLKANEWRIPVVHPIWIFDSILRGAGLSFDDYFLDSKCFNGCNVWSKLIGTKDQDFKEDKNIDKSRIKLRHTTDIWNSIMGQAKGRSNFLTKDSAWEELIEEEDKTTLNETHEATNEVKKGLFLNQTFLLVGFTDAQVSLISRVVESNNGEVTSELTHRNISYIAIPAEKGLQSSHMLRILPPSIKERVTKGSLKVVTEWFIERSIFYNRIVLDSWCFPLSGIVKTARRFKVCISGFTGIELLHVEKLVKYMGLTYCDTLTSSRDLLVVNINVFKLSLVKNSPILFEYKFNDIISCPVYKSGVSSVSTLATKNKVNAAKQWKIPVVSIAFLWEALQLSIGKTDLQIPRVMDYAWCLYAPVGHSKEFSLAEFAERQQTITEPLTPKKRPRDENVKVTLPSPRNGNKKHKYGRLSGNPSPKSLTADLHDAQLNIEADVTNPDEQEPLTQVKYGQVEPDGNDLLIQKLTSEQQQLNSRRLRRRR
ncbi:uncharacterized protein PRCAT00003403001 [Priceomyces carsonii]|uniref:uncharacterized protein n=1 Tax=Priceomyces carsonii TaxID=28549 RepID=UPI002ED8396D|nr:unnamed protein product [Priceomyces carsonii]